jgi:hypothetical protein
MRLFALDAEALQTVGTLGLTVGDTPPVPLWGAGVFLAYLTDPQAELLIRHHVAMQDVTPAKLRDVVADRPVVPAVATPGDAVVASSNAPEKKLRMTVDGEHFYAEIAGGRIRMNDRMFDSLAHARDAVRREQNKLGVWEYFDETACAWKAI